MLAELELVAIWNSLPATALPSAATSNLRAEMALAPYPYWVVRLRPHLLLAGPLPWQQVMAVQQMPRAGSWRSRVGRVARRRVVQYLLHLQTV